MRIALIQQHATDPDKTANIERGLRAVEHAGTNGAELIAFAELAFEPFFPQYPAPAERHDHPAETIPGPMTDAFAKVARKLGVVIVINLFELDERTGNTFDSSPVIDADGSILGVTRMVHITDYACFHEKDYYTPGDRGAPVYNTRIGKLGVAICYDRHFPEYMRALALNGAEIVFIPQAGAVGEWPDGLYEAEIRTAAFQNGYFAALCNRVGQEHELTFAGESFICNPAGEVVARAPQGEDFIVYADLDMQEVKESHARRLFLRDRRPELYTDWLGS